MALVLVAALGASFKTTHWWVSLFPGVAIMPVVMAMNLMGDWLDPKQRKV